MGYNVLSTIRHDGVEFHAGDIIHDITSEAAKELIAVKALAPLAEAQIEEDVSHVEQMTNDAKTEGLTPEEQAAQDLAQSQAEAEALKNTPAKPVTTGSTTPEQVAAEAAKVK
jgi:hypothetical protein